MHVKDKEKSLIVMRCLKMQSVCEFSIVWGIDFMGTFSRASRGETKYIAGKPSITFPIGLKPRRSPPTMLEVVVKSFKSFSSRFGAPRANISESREEDKVRNYSDSKIKNPILQCGDQVLLFNSRIIDFLGKAQSRGPDLSPITDVYLIGTCQVVYNDTGSNFKSIAPPS
ncbi:hypothetical protein Tco_0400514 [Tanacetum coccineum]